MQARTQLEDLDPSLIEDAHAAGEKCSRRSTLESRGSRRGKILGTLPACYVMRNYGLKYIITSRKTITSRQTTAQGIAKPATIQASETSL